MYEKKNKRRIRMTAIEKVIRRFHNGKLQIDRDVLAKLLNKDVVIKEDLTGKITTFYPTRLLLQTDSFSDEIELKEIKSEDVTDFYIHKDEKKKNYIASTINIHVNNVGVLQLNLFDYIAFSQPLTMEEFLEIKKNIDSMLEIEKMFSNILKKSITNQPGLNILKKRETKANRLLEILKMNDKLSEDIKLLVELQSW